MAGVLAMTPDSSVSQVPRNLHRARRRGKHDTQIAAREDSDLAAWGEATTRGVPQRPKTTHPCAMGLSGSYLVLHASHPRRWEGTRLRKGHHILPHASNSIGASRVALLGRSCSPPIGGYGGLGGAPSPWTSAPNPGYPKN